MRLFTRRAAVSALCLVLSPVCIRAEEAGKPAAATPAQKIGRDGKPDPRFLAKHEEFLAVAKKGEADVLFLGDSITEGWRGAGKDVWAKHFAPLKAANFGIGGDRTQHVLWRIDNGELDGIKPKVVVLMIGTNNSHADVSDHIAAGVKAVVAGIRAKLPETKVLLLAVFPRGAKPNPQREKLAAVNKEIAGLDDGKTVRYLDIGPKFLTADGTLEKEIMPDYLHLSPKGYAIWAEAILPLLGEMLGSAKP
jgi:lysophospholipase L1-like esterase